MTVAELLRQGAGKLRRVGIVGADRDARWLLCDLLGVEAAGLMAIDDAPAPPDLATAFSERIDARATGKPVAKILGHKAFHGLDFLTGEATLDPRPETELLVDLGLRFAPPAGDPKILDIGTGTGCVLLSLLHELPGATGLGVDISPEALDVARRNAERLGLDRARFEIADWWPEECGFDLVLSNPPYVSEAEMAGLGEALWDPHIALTPGGDGTAPYREIARGFHAHASAHARLIVEIGYRQGPAVAEIFRAAGLREIALHPDLDGRDRAVSAAR